MKSKNKIVLAIIPFAVIIILVLSYFGFKAWWGDAHTVLYNVKSITAYDKTDTDGYYEIKIDASVRNWLDDFETKEYYLDGPNPLGDVDYSGTGVINPPKLTVTNQKSKFMLIFRVVPDDVKTETLQINRREYVESFLYALRFAATNEEGLYTEDGHELFMSDFRHVKVEWKD